LRRVGHGALRDIVRWDGQWQFAAALHLARDPGAFSAPWAATTQHRTPRSGVTILASVLAKADSHNISASRVACCCSGVLACSLPAVIGSLLRKPLSVATGWTIPRRYRCTSVPVGLAFLLWQVYFLSRRSTLSFAVVAGSVFAPLRQVCSCPACTDHGVARPAGTV